MFWTSGTKVELLINHVPPQTRPDLIRLWPFQNNWIMTMSIQTSFYIHPYLRTKYINPAQRIHTSCRRRLGLDSEDMEWLIHATTERPTLIQWKALNESCSWESARHAIFHGVQPSIKRPRTTQLAFCGASSGKITVPRSYICGISSCQLMLKQKQGDKIPALLCRLLFWCVNLP
jgi:hypothetical protein